MVAGSDDERVRDVDLKLNAGRITMELALNMSLNAGGFGMKITYGVTSRDLVAGWQAEQLESSLDSTIIIC